MSRFKEKEKTLSRKKFECIKQVKFGCNYASKIARKIGKTRQWWNSQLKKLEKLGFLKSTGVNPIIYSLSDKGDKKYDELKDEMNKRKEIDLLADYLGKAKDVCGATGNEKIDEYLESIIKCGNFLGIANIFEMIKNSLNQNDVPLEEYLELEIFSISNQHPEKINIELLNILQEIVTI